ncbi:hypothetical protein BH23BAC3_BH23BAC3_22190 [soil metagenome]
MISESGEPELFVLQPVVNKVILELILKYKAGYIECISLSNLQIKTR